MNTELLTKDLSSELINTQTNGKTYNGRKQRSSTKKGTSGPQNTHINKTLAQSNNIKAKYNPLRPFIVLKKPDLLGKRSLEKALDNSEGSLSSKETNSEFETQSKIIKGNTSIINLSNVNQKNLTKNGILPPEKLDLGPRIQNVKSQELPDSESNHSTNDDLIEESNDFHVKQVKLPDYILELRKKCNSKENQEKHRKFWSSYKPDTNHTKSRSFFDMSFPINYALPQEKKELNDFSYDLEIITNKNEKEKIKVSFQPGKVNMVDQIPNKMDTNAREAFFGQFNFVTDYKSGYAPIDIQAKQKQEEFSYKDHFIKKKQASSSARLKRTCGVSYVKESESQQLHVNHIFQKLLPLVFQGSTDCTRYEGDYQSFIERVFENVFKEETNKYILVTTFEAEDEGLLREYLLYPERRAKLVKGKIYLLKSLDALWCFLKDKQFICIHLCYDEKEFIKPIELKDLSKEEVLMGLAKSNLQLGFLCKKSTSGKKAFLKSFVEGTDLKWEEESCSDSEDEDENGKVNEEKKTKKNEMIIEGKKKGKEEEKVRKKKAKKEKNTMNKEKKQKKTKRKEEAVSEDENDLIEEEEDDEDEPRISQEQINRFQQAKKKTFYNEFYNSTGFQSLANHANKTMKEYLSLISLSNNTAPVQTEIVRPVESSPSASAQSSQSSTSYDLQILIEATDFEQNTLEEGLYETVGDHKINGFIKKSEGPIPEEKSVQKVSLFKESESQMECETRVEESEKIEERGKDEMVIEINEEEGAFEEKGKKTKKGKEKENKKNKHENNKITHDSSENEMMAIIEEIRGDPNKHIPTLSARIELYLPEKSWKTASSHTRNLLYTFITHAVDALQEKFRGWTKMRMDISKNNIDSDILFRKKNNIFMYNCDANYSEEVLSALVSHQNNNNWSFDPAIKSLDKEEIHYYKEKLVHLKSARDVSFADVHGINEVKDRELALFALPLYQITTRDSFAYDLIEKVTVLDLNGRKTKKIEYFFDPSSYPYNFKSFVEKFPDYRVGVTTYTDFFTNEELCEIEDRCYETERNFFSNHFLPMTGQMTCTSEKVRRTKFFFGARYMWTRQQLSEAHSMVGAGIRVDVTEPPKWMRELVEKPMVDVGILEKDFVNSIAMNVYHDGKEGIAQHFDDAIRFKQPIYSLRIFSDSRLSFGSQLYGFCNGAFCIPMPRGCITIMEEDSYAANGIKHCVRPCDMTGKSAALILRQMHHRVFNEAKLYDEFVDFPTWFSTLSIKNDAVSYADQKRIEGEEALKGLKRIKVRNNVSVVFEKHFNVFFCY